MSSDYAVVFKLVVLTRVLSDMFPTTLRGQRNLSEVGKLKVEIVRVSSFISRSDRIVDCYWWKGQGTISSRPFILQMQTLTL